MNLLKKSLAVVLTFSLAVLTPGLGVVDAAATVIGAAARSASAPGAGAGVVGANLGSITRVGSSLAPLNVSLAQPTLNALNHVNPTFQTAPLATSVSQVPATAKTGQLQATGIAPAVASPQTFALQTAVNSSVEAFRTFGVAAQGERAPPSKAKRSVLKGLRQALPKFSKMDSGAAKATAHVDFLARIGHYRTASQSGAALPSARSITNFSRTSGLQSANLSAKDSEATEEMPDYKPESSSNGRLISGEIDDLGNPVNSNTNRDRFTGEESSGGFDEMGGSREGNGYGTLFGALPGLFAGSSMFVANALFSLTLPQLAIGYVAIVLPSLVIHEMSHAWLANKLGDAGPRLQGRMNGKFWTAGFYRDVWNHVNAPITILGMRIPLGLSFVVPLGTLTLSMLTMGMPLIFGGARPVSVQPRRLMSSSRSEMKGMGLVAATGPITHIVLGTLLGIGHMVALMAGAPAVLLTTLAVGAWVNVLLAVFNALPFFPLDGHHILRSIIGDGFGKRELAATMFGSPTGQISRGARIANIYALIGTIVFLFAPVVLPAVNAITSLMLAGSTFVAGAALSGVLKGEGGRFADSESVLPPNSMVPAGPEAAPREEMPDSKLLVVRFSGTRKQLTENLHLSLVQTRGAGGIARLQAVESQMATQLETLGVGMGLLSKYSAQPVATYKDINSATLRVPETEVAAMTAALEASGHEVFDNEKERREIVRPIEDDPEQPLDKMDIQAAVSMEETLKISTMDKVHEAARQQWGSPFASGFLKKIMTWLGAVAPQPKIGVIDTGVEADHRLVAPHLAAAKDTNDNGNGADDNGHGTWVTSMVAWFAPWLKNSITHYKAFQNGGATLDDILKALTMAADDGNIVISNSWGSSNGDPNSPDSELVGKLAEKGHIMVFAAGNSGYYGTNTIGSPAIVHQRAANGTPRVIAVAATKRNKMRASFSSRGAGSRQTRRLPDYPRKPDIAEQGENTEGAWLGGRTRAISGTSMSTPKLAGTIAMLAMLFGVTQVGEELDRIVKAVFDTLTNEFDQKPIDIGDGFSVAYAAYESLRAQGFAPVRRGLLQRLIVWLMDRGGRRGPPAQE
jgi:Zn-dependent protease